MRQHAEMGAKSLNGNHINGISGGIGIVPAPPGMQTSAMAKPQRHWKVKDWKRRSTVRKAKAQQTRLVAEQA